MDHLSSDAPQGDPGIYRYTSLGDYLRVIRRRRLTIALATFVMTAGALAYSLAQTPTYQASAQLSFPDRLENIDFLAGVGSSRVEPPQVRAAANAELINRPEVTRRVVRELDTDVPPGALRSAVSTTIGVQTQLVSVIARWPDPEFAADLANAYARAAQRVRTQEEREALNRTERTIRDELRNARDADPPAPFRVSLLEGQLTQVRTLAGATEPAQLVSHAQVPAAPVSPNTTRNGILGGALGLLLGLGLAFGREALDRRLYSAHDVHRELGMPVLGRVSKSALGYPGLVRNGGLRMTEADFEAFRVLRMNLAALPTEGRLRSILVTSALPEEGKTTVSLSLASAAAASGQRVLLAECDLRRPSFAKRLGLEQRPGLADYLQGTAEPQEVLQVAELVEPLRINGGRKPAGDGASAGTLVCITAGSESSQPAELLLGSRFDSFLEKVTRAYDLVILDSSPLLSVVDPLELISRVDAVIVCVRVHSTTRDQARAARAALGHLPERPSGAVVTGIRRDDHDAYEYYYGY